jgi:ElaB/YqjD/DUF883 family membrane-anchored ribosome-binding protein
MSQGPQSGTRSAGGDTSVGANLKPQVSDIAEKVAKTREDVVGLAGTASNLAGAALDQGRNLLDNARDQATSYADRRKDEAAESVASLASSLRNTGEAFEGRENIQAFVESAADGLEQLADSIRERSFQEIYDEVETFARNRPVAVGAATVVAGFLLARFIKSSAEGMSESGARAAAARGGARIAARPGAPRAAARAGA